VKLASSVTTTRTITITPFIDNVVANNEITAGEFAGTPITLTFHRGSEITATTTIAAVTAGTRDLVANVTLDKDINLAAIGGGVDVRFSKNGVAIAGDVAAVWDKDEAALVATKASQVAASNDVFTAQARIAAANSGSASSAVVTAGTVTTLTNLVVDAGSSYRNGGTIAGVTVSNDAVRAGAGTVVVSTKATGVNSAVIAGANVIFTIEEMTGGITGTSAASVDAGASITAGGKTLSGSPAAAQKVTVEVATDADGVAKLSIAYAGLKDGNTFRVTMSTAGPTATITATGKYFTANDSFAAALVDVNKLGGLDGVSPVHATTVGGPVNVSYRLVDQFGQTPAIAHRLRVAYKTGSDAINSTVTVTGGVGALSIADNSSAAGAHVATSTVERFDADDTVTPWKSTGISALGSTIQVVSALPAGTRVTVTENPDTLATTPQNTLSSAALATVDSRISLTSVDTPAAVGGNSKLSGSVFGAGGALQAGASVTLSAPGLMFVTGGVHYSLGSTTVKTDANGAWGEVQLLSTTAGKHTVTVTSGSGTTTTDVFFGAAAADAGDKVTITAPASVLPGSTLQVSAVVTDKFGNPVNTAATGAAGTAADVAITYTGPGLVVGTLPTETDKDGKVQLSVLMGSNDRGTFSVTVTYRIDGAATDAADLIATTANVTVGSVAAVAGEARAWTRFLSATDELKIYARDVVNAGKIQFIVNGTEIAWIRATSAADPKLNVASDGMVRSVFVRDMLQGRNVIEIYEDGVRIERRIFTR
jgi:hypothetical protein